MASGVHIDDECKSAFAQELKLGKQHRYILFKLSDDLKSVVVQKRAPKDSTYEDLCSDFNEAEQKGECRYAVYDLDYTTLQGNAKTKLAFFAWSPDTAKIKQKMVYASTKDAFKKALGDGLAKEIQANDDGDLQWDEVVKKMRETDRN